MFHISISGGLELCLGGINQPKPPRGDGNDTTFISPFYENTQTKLNSSTVANRPVNSLGHQEERKVFWEGPTFFELCPIFQTISNTFFQGGKNVSRGEKLPLRPPGYGPGRQQHKSVTLCITFVLYPWNLFWKTDKSGISVCKNPFIVWHLMSFTMAPSRRQTDQATQNSQSTTYANGWTFAWRDTLYFRGNDSQQNYGTAMVCQHQPCPVVANVVMQNTETQITLLYLPWICWNGTLTTRMFFRNKIY